MKYTLSILLSMAISAQPALLFAERSVKPLNSDVNFDGSRQYAGGAIRTTGNRAYNNRPRVPELRSNFSEIPPVYGAEANGEEGTYAAAPPPHLAWDWDKTVAAAGGAIVGAMLGFLVGGPIGAAVGFVAGMMLGAIAGNILEAQKNKQKNASCSGGNCGG